MSGFVAGKNHRLPTFYADNMLAYLLGQERVRHQFYQVVDGVDAWMDRLESLDLLSDGEGVGHVGQIVLVISHAVTQAGLQRLESLRKWASNSYLSHHLVSGIHVLPGDDTNYNKTPRISPIQSRTDHFITTYNWRLSLVSLNSAVSNEQKVTSHRSFLDSRYKQ